MTDRPDPLGTLDAGLIRSRLAAALEALSPDDVAERVQACRSGGAPPATLMHRLDDGTLEFWWGGRALVRLRLDQLTRPELN